MGGRLLTHVLGVALLVGVSSGLYFDLKESETKCFIEEVPTETMISGAPDRMSLARGGANASAQTRAVHGFRCLPSTGEARGRLVC